MEQWQSSGRSGRYRRYSRHAEGCCNPDRLGVLHLPIVAAGLSLGRGASGGPNPSCDKLVLRPRRLDGAHDAPRRRRERPRPTPDLRGHARVGTATSGSERLHGTQGALGARISTAHVSKRRAARHMHSGRDYRLVSVRFSSSESEIPKPPPSLLPSAAGAGDAVVAVAVVDVEVLTRGRRPVTAERGTNLLWPGRPRMRPTAANRSVD